MLASDYQAKTITPADLNLHEATLYDVVAFCCIVESLNASLLLATLDHAQEPLIRKALREILKDEINHSRIGWGHLHAERSAGRGQFIAPHLPQMILNAGAHEVMQPDSLRDDDALLYYGELSWSKRMQVFEQTFETVIIPGFRSMSMDTGPLQNCLNKLLKR